MPSASAVDGCIRSPVREVQAPSLARGASARRGERMRQIAVAAAGKQVCARLDAHPILLLFHVRSTSPTWARSDPTRSTTLPGTAMRWRCCAVAGTRACWIPAWWWTGSRASAGQRTAWTRQGITCAARDAMDGQRGSGRRCGKRVTRPPLSRAGGLFAAYLRMRVNKSSPASASP